MSAAARFAKKRRAKVSSTDLSSTATSHSIESKVEGSTLNDSTAGHSNAYSLLQTSLSQMRRDLTKHATFNTRIAASTTAYNAAISLLEMGEIVMAVEIASRMMTVLLEGSDGSER